MPSSMVMAFLTGIEEPPAKGDLALLDNSLCQRLYLLLPISPTGGYGERNILHRGIVSLTRVSSQTEEERITAMEADPGSPARVYPTEEKATFLRCGYKAPC